MKEEITIEVFNHLVGLAALELDEQQAQYLRRELNQQLKAIHELEAIPLDENLKINAHGVEYTPQSSPNLRSDEWILFADTQEILDQLPQRDERFVVVPDIPHEKLD
jgi:aspartyl/glutamyl-tRNA(Asn/Gln) amidotransferase C subunit